MVAVQVVGGSEQLKYAVPAFSQTGLSARFTCHRPASPFPDGLPNRGSLTLALWQPGMDPVLEEALFSDGTPVLHAWWGEHRASVGPFVARGASPCPACQRSVTGTGGPVHPLLASWALSWASLEAQAYLSHGTSELIGACWSWDLRDPGLQLHHLASPS